MRVLDPGVFFGRLRRHSRVAGLILAECDHSPGERVPRHGHADAFLCLVLQGAFEETVADEKRRYAPGAVVFHPAGEVHADRIAPTGARLFNVVLPNGWGCRLASMSTQQRPPAGPHSGAASAVAVQLYREFRRGRSASELAIEGIALTLLGECCRGGSRTSAVGPSWLAAVRDFLASHARERFVLARAARVAGVHPTHLARTFRRFTGETMGQHMRRLRVEWASQELVATDRPLADLALAAGFSDQAHFCRVFRRSTGLRPREFRRGFRS